MHWSFSALPKKTSCERKKKASKIVSFFFFFGYGGVIPLLLVSAILGPLLSLLVVSMSFNDFGIVT